MPSIQRAATLAYTLVALGFAAPVGAQVYRWVDADGMTVYSQTPPEAASSDVVRPSAAPSDAERQQAEERARNMVEEDLNRREDRALDKEKAQKEREAAATKVANCAAARKNLAALEQSGQVRLKTPDGQVLTLSEDELAARLRETRARIDADCE